MGAANKGVHPCDCVSSSGCHPHMPHMPSCGHQDSSKHILKRSRAHHEPLHTRHHEQLDTLSGSGFTYTSNYPSCSPGVTSSTPLCLHLALTSPRLPGCAPS